MTLPSIRLDDQVALVTGAASGIGRGTALGLAASGSRVACIDLAPTSGSIVDRGLLQAHDDPAEAAVVHLSRSLAMGWADPCDPRSTPPERTAA